MQPDDFINDNGAATNSDPAEQPMDFEDYGIIDSLTPEMLQAIDQGLIAGVTSSRDTRVARLIGVFMMRHPAAVPGLPDYFYLMRVERMLESGVLRVSGDAENLIQCDVRLA